MVFALAGMVLVFVGVGYLLADQWHVDSARDIPVQRARVAALVGDLSTWADWASMDANLGPGTTRTVLGTPGTAGHALQWSGSRGMATLTLRRVTPDGIEYDFHGRGPQQQELQWRASGRIEWRETPDGCRVQWHDEGHWDSLAGRWIGWFGAMQQRAQEIQGTSLAGLAETLAVPAAEAARR
jgi:hypothetical protein